MPMTSTKSVLVSRRGRISYLGLIHIEILLTVDWL